MSTSTLVRSLCCSPISHEVVVPLKLRFAMEISPIFSSLKLPSKMLDFPMDMLIYVYLYGYLVVSGEGEDGPRWLIDLSTHQGFTTNEGSGSAILSGIGWVGMLLIVDL